MDYNGDELYRLWSEYSVNWLDDERLRRLIGGGWVVRQRAPIIKDGLVTIGVFKNRMHMRIEYRWSEKMMKLVRQHRPRWRHSQ